jgi:flagellar biosynthesis/type III secretory pathway M-ring protein FliF/YscJ
MDSGVAYIFAIVLVVLVINVFIIRAQFRRGNSKVRKRRTDRAALGEPEQAIWRDKEVARRIEREQDGAYERVTLKNETLAIYDEVRRRHAKEDELERLSLNMSDNERDGYDMYRRNEELAHIEQEDVLHESDDNEDRVTMIPFEDDL